MTDDEFAKHFVEDHAKGLDVLRSFIKEHDPKMKRVAALVLRGGVRAKSETRKKGERIPDGFPDQPAKDRAISHWSTVGRPDLASSVEQHCLEFRSWATDPDDEKKRPRWGATWGNWFRTVPNRYRVFGKLALVETAPANVPAASLATWLLRLEMFYGRVEDNPAGTWSPSNGSNPDDPRNAVPALAWASYRAKWSQAVLPLPDPRREA